MRHRVRGKKLNRTPKHRQALVKNLVGSLMEHGEITTTQVKAKVVKSRFDRLVTLAKKDTLSSRQRLHRFFGKRQLVNALVDKITPQLKNRISGYTTIQRLHQRRGDDTILSRLSFVDHVVLARPKSPSQTPHKPPKNNRKKAVSTV